MEHRSRVPPPSERKPYNGKLSTAHVCLPACVHPEPNSVTETGLDELDLFSTRPHGQLRNNVSKPAIPHVDTRFPKHSLKKHISGSKSRPATPHADTRFRKHPPKKHISGSRSKPAITQVDARFCKHQLETQVTS